MLGFTIGLRTLRAAQQSMDLVGQNVANASTPGYARRLAQLVTTDPQRLARFGFGTGVAVADLLRVHDGLLEGRLREQRHVLGRLDAAGGLLRQIEGSFREPGDRGIAAQLDGFFNALSELTGLPDDSSFRSGLVQAGTELGASFRELSAAIAAAGEQAQRGAAGAVDAVNSLLADLAAVNRHALEARQAGAAPADLADQRDRLLQELAQWVDAQVIERPGGTIDVLVDGLLVVSGDRARPLQARSAAGGAVTLHSADGRQEVAAGSGRLRGYLDLARLTVPQRLAELDRTARALILEVNRVHTTGVGALGPYAQLTSGVGVPAGRRGDALATLDLPFPIQAGRLAVNVVETATGAVTQHFVAVDPARMSLDDLAAALDALPRLAATVDPAGRLRVVAESGFGFDFSSRLDVDPDDAGSFGSDRATLTSGPGPFALADGDTLTLSVNGAAPQTVTFDAVDFADIGRATAAEVAAVIEAQLSGVSASAQDGRLVVRSDAAGAGTQLQVVAASNPVLFAAGASDAGSGAAVAVRLDGAPTAGHSGRFTVRALGDGVIGLTPGLRIELLDGSGASLGTFDAGAGYTPGDPIQLVPGVTLTLTAGSVQQSAGDVFEFDLVGDADTADALVALELGAFFTGRSAADLALAPTVAADPRRIAGSRTGRPNDGSGFRALRELADAALADLDGRTIGRTYADLVASAGFDVRGNESAASSQGLLLAALEARREEISGVNTDEEMLKLLEYQHLYQAAGRYLQSVSRMTDELFQIL